jgi:hypothetical protein
MHGETSPGLGLSCNRLTGMVNVYSQLAEFSVAQLKFVRMAKLRGWFASFFLSSDVVSCVFKTGKLQSVGYRFDICGQIVEIVDSKAEGKCC